jgi:hypothetical protein
MANTMREIAAFIADLAIKGEPLPPEAAAAVFEEVAQWALSETKPDCRAPVSEFLYDYTCMRKRLKETRHSLFEEYVRWARPYLLHGYRVFEADAKTRTGTAAVKAIAELRRTFSALPGALQNAVPDTRLDIEIRDLEDARTRDTAFLVAMRQLELEREFAKNCSRASRKVFNEGTRRFGWWPKWTAQLDAESRARFFHNVHYNDLPMEMQRWLERRYQDWSQITADGLRKDIEWTYLLWMGAIVTVVLLELVQLIKPFPVDQ